MTAVIVLEALRQKSARLIYPAHLWNCSCVIKLQAQLELNEHLTRSNSLDLELETCRLISFIVSLRAECFKKFESIIPSLVKMNSNDTGVYFLNVSKLLLSNGTSWNIFNLSFHRAMLGGLVLLVVLACCCCRYNTVRKDALRTQSSSAYWLGMEEEQSCTTPAQQVNNHFNACF